MALRKPSDFFNKKPEDINIAIVESDSSLRDELSKVETLSNQVIQLQKELSQKVVKNDLESIVLSQINNMHENFEYLRKEFKYSNKKDIGEFKEKISEITNIVANLVENEIPKYRKHIKNNQIIVGDKFDKLKEGLKKDIEIIEREVNTKIDSITFTVDENIEQFNKKLQKTSSEVTATVNTYNQLSKIVESRISKENDQLDEYSKIIESLYEAFVELEISLQNETSTQLQVIEDKFEIISSDVNSRIDSIDEEVDNVKNKVSSEILGIKADVVINEQHLKNFGESIKEYDVHLEDIDKYLQEHHKELITLREEVFAEIEQIPVGNFQENLQRLEKKIDYIKETYSNIKPEVIVKEVIKEGLLNEPPETKNSDPLTPLNKNFVTFDQLQEHYRLFINRIQQQISTLGGGGETRLKYLDDIVGIATNASNYDGKFLKYDHSSQKFEFVTPTIAATVPGEKNIVYVAKDGNDSYPGTLSLPKYTIKAAVESIVSSGSTDRVIRVAPGTYIENNPITLPDEVTIIGHSLRETTIIPQNDNKDLFYVGNGNYIAEMSFRGSLPGKAIISFDPEKPRYITQSPYIQNCTNFIPDSIGLKVDGNAAIGPIKSMVLDSYTQYNQGGIGASITNQGYAQLVSLFTICNDIAVYCGSGGACDLTNSNSSFGNFGLVSDGVSGKKYSGIITQTSSALADTFVVDLSTPNVAVSTSVYDNVSGIVTITTSTNHNFNVGMGVSITGLQFTCPSGPGALSFPSGNNGYNFNVREVISNNQFSVCVGTSTLPHSYISGGTVKTEVVRPFDGQAIYFNDLYNIVKTIQITNGGSGYSSTPIITIDPPSAPWGIRAKAIATIQNGSITQIDMISNGRGYTTVPNITISAPSSGINTAVGLAVLTPEYYTINSSTEISNGISTITINENIPFAVGVGTTVNFFKQSRILATGHSFEFIGSGTDIANSIPFSGGTPPNEENETDSRSGGLVVYTSTNQSGNFKIGDGVTINQNTSNITGQAYQKSLVSTMTPYILSLGAL